MRRQRLSFSSFGFLILDHFQQMHFLAFSVVNVMTRVCVRVCVHVCVPRLNCVERALTCPQVVSLTIPMCFVFGYLQARAIEWFVRGYP